MKFIINGNKALSGDIYISGSKNATLPILAACILTDDTVILNNIPKLKDVKVMLQLLSNIGANLTFLDEKHITV